MFIFWLIAALIYTGLSLFIQAENGSILYGIIISTIAFLLVVCLIDIYFLLTKTRNLILYFILRFLNPFIIFSIVAFLQYS